MRCEFHTRAGRGCSRTATRPVEDELGFCRWSCTQHGRGLKTYYLYRPEPTILDELAAASCGEEPMAYDYEP